LPRSASGADTNMCMILDQEVLSATKRSLISFCLSKSYLIIFVGAFVSRHFEAIIPRIGFRL